LGSSMNSAEPPPVWSRSLNKPLDPAVPGKAVAELSAVTDTSWLLLKIPEPEITWPVVVMLFGMMKFCTPVYDRFVKVIVPAQFCGATCTLL